MKTQSRYWRGAFAAVAAAAALAAAVQVIAQPAAADPAATPQATDPMGPGMQRGQHRMQGMQHGMGGGHGPMGMMGGGMGGMHGGPGMGGMGGMGGTGGGPGMGMGGMGMGMMSPAMQSDPAAAADLGLVHQMLAGHESIARTVTRLPDGIRTVTESDDPQVAQQLKAHVASMEGRLREGREFNLFSKTIPVLFANRDKIETKVEQTAKGIVFTQTSTDKAVVTALQDHADEVSELARDGMVAMRRGMHQNMGGMGGSGMGGMGAGMHGGRHGPMAMMGGGGMRHGAMHE